MINDGPLRKSGGTSLVRSSHAIVGRDSLTRKCGGLPHPLGGKAVVERQDTIYQRLMREVQDCVRSSALYLRRVAAAFRSLYGKCCGRISVKEAAVIAEGE